MNKTLKLIFSAVLISVLSFNCFAKKISPQRQQFIDCALSLLGTPYLYGSRVPSPGIDCSGLVAFAARKALKVNFTGSSQGMYWNSTEISDSEREPGDLLFFSNTNDSSHITHVGIYLGKYKGEGEFKNKTIFIHSVSDGRKTGVIITSLDDENFWTRHYISSGRFLPATKDAETFIHSDPKLFEIDTWWKNVDCKKWFDE